MTTSTRSTDTPYVLGQEEGEHRHFLNHLATTKVRPGDRGSLSVVEFVAPRGFGPPLHCHDDEDEIMVLLDGEIAFSSGDDQFTAQAGATVFLPNGVPHTFQVLSDSARFSTVTASATGRPRFDQFVAELGDAIEGPDLPEPTEIDPAQVAEVAAANGIQIMGPPPAPLAD